LGPGPETIPVTSTTPLVRGKRTVTVAFCSASPLVVPVQAPTRGGAPGSGAQAKLSTPTVVGTNAAGVLPGTVPTGAGALSVIAIAPEVLRAMPVTTPLTVQVPPISV